MQRLDGKKDFYDDPISGISQGRYYTHYIPVDLRNIPVGKFIEKLSYFLSFGVLSRRLLDQYPLIKGKDYEFWGGNLNDQDYVSLTKVEQGMDLDIHDHESSYIKFLHYPAIIISSEIEEYLIFRAGEYSKMSDEVQVKNGVPIDFIIGVRVPSLPSIDNERQFGSNITPATYDQIYEAIDRIGLNILLYSDNNMAPILRAENSPRMIL